MKRRILFVDDEPHVLDGLRRMLSGERSRWALRFAGHADAALSALRAADFDAVVSDVNMPGKDGFALLAEIRAADRTRDVPVVILTGRDDRDLKRRALDLGATDLLSKPVDPQDLIARLRSAIRLKVQQDELKNHNAVLEQKVAERTAELAESRLDIIWRLGKAAEFRDEETGNHVVRVGCYSRVLAEALGMEREFVELLFLTTPLHDIGKIGVPDRILGKRGRLTPDEWETMKRHCAIGADILRQDPRIANAYLVWRGDRKDARHARPESPILDTAASVALTHHERWDGSGYPAGLSGEQIPLEARIAALCDVYDALRSARPYKPAYSESEAVEIVEREAGRHFDPSVCAAFARSREEFRSIRAELSDEPHAPVCLG